MSRLALAALAAALLAAAPALAAARYVRTSFYGDVKQADTNTTYRLRVAYTVPAKYRALASKRRLVRRFGPIGSCRITLEITARAAAGEVEDATARVEKALPASGRALRDYGTRRNAAFRVVRVAGQGVRGLYATPAPSVKTQPAGKRLWLELDAAGTIDPNVECHSGGPRSVADEIANAFATARLGGFQF